MQALAWQQQESRYLLLKQYAISPASDKWALKLAVISLEHSVN